MAVFFHRLVIFSIHYLPSIRLRRPVPVLVPTVEGFLQRFGDGHRLQDEGLGGAHVATVREALAGEGQVVALPDGVVVYLMDGDATFYHRHGAEQAGELAQHVAHEGARKAFVSAQRGEPEHGAYVGGGIVLRRRGPTADDGFYRKGLACGAEVFPVALEQFPAGTVTVGHALELHERCVGLLGARTLPAVGRVADVERVVVS